MGGGGRGEGSLFGGFVMTVSRRRSFQERQTPWGHRMFIFFSSLVAQTVKNLPAMQETGFNPWVGKIPWRRE